MTDTKTQLLKHATNLIQQRGYNGFSFHDLADLMKIKTASIHYHFPTKQALGEAVIALYTSDFVAALGDPKIGSAEERLRHYSSLFQRSAEDGNMCLCGMIGAEIGGLPADLRQSINGFFAKNKTWLTSVFMCHGLNKAAACQRALVLLAALEGALLVARASAELSDFKAIAKQACIDALIVTP